MGNKITRRRILVDERYTRPQGVYQPSDFDYKKLRRLILDAKLAPCYPGTEDFCQDLDECPICFMFYPSLNRSKCCSKGICTECFLQVKSPQATRPTQCPFCKTPNYAVEYWGAKSLEEKGIEQAEEQKVIEVKIRMRQKEVQDEVERLKRREAILEGSTDTTETDAPPMMERSPEGSWGLREPHRRSLESQPEDLTNAEETASIGSVEMNLGRTVTAHCQATRMPSFSVMRPSRDEEFDFDIEDIMVMEAIWLSIQNQDSCHASYAQSNQNDMISASNGTNETFISDLDPTANLPVFSSATARDSSRRSSVTGSFAGAIAALAEQQVFAIRGVTTWQNEHNQTGVEDHATVVPEYQNTPTKVYLHGNASDRENAEDQSTLPYTLQAQCYRRMDGHVDPEAEQAQSINSDLGDERHPLTWLETQELYDPEIAQGINRWLEVSTSELRGGSRGSTSEWTQDQSSEAVEVGTSFSSSIPSASELPWEAPDVISGSLADGAADPQVVTAPLIVPETFEEQMMLAMALSLTEAQTHLR